MSAFSRVNRGANTRAEIARVGVGVEIATENVTIAGAVYYFESAGLADEIIIVFS